MNADLAAVNYSFLEYRAIALGAELPAYPGQQINRIRKLKQVNRRASKDNPGKRRAGQKAGQPAGARADGGAAQKAEETRRGGVRWRRF
jgi:hypothetical protein